MCRHGKNNWTFTLYVLVVLVGSWYRTHSTGWMDGSKHENMQRLEQCTNKHLGSFKLHFNIGTGSLTRTEDDPGRLPYLRTSEKAWVPLFDRRRIRRH
mmetsp:Transcript_65051/g.89415  ORF Transcript_65051/g.89415 Transcript_65051/m.89415 type:complete len:98 (+) Transcript_65051:284-577(+)